MFQSSPDVNSLKDLTKETEDTDFWKNFKKGAPIVFCMAIEDDQNLKQERDLSFIEELMKTKNILKLLKTKVDEGAADIDIIEYASAVTLLEYKLQVLNALNISVDSDSDDKISFNIVGTSKSMVIDKAKLKEAITIMDSPVVETQGASSGSLTKDLPEISADLNDEEFLEEVKKVVGDIKKTPKKTLDKESFVKIFKYTGDYAKRKTRQVKAEGQAKRCQVFDDPDSKKYLQAIQDHIASEEKAFEGISLQVFDKLCITPECFERSQQDLMNDPYVGMELFNMGIQMEHPTCDLPAELTEAKTVELVLDSNNYAFERFKKDYIDMMGADPMMMPVVISCIAHDWVKKNHGIDEETFKSGLFTHKIYENAKVAEQMQTKQTDLLMLAAKNNPMLAMQM